MGDLDTSPYYETETRNARLASPPMPLDDSEKLIINMRMNRCASLFRTFRNRNFPRNFKEPIMDELVELMELLDNVDNTHKFCTADVRSILFMNYWDAFLRGQLRIEITEDPTPRHRG